MLKPEELRPTQGEPTGQEIRPISPMESPTSPVVQPNTSPERSVLDRIDNLTSYFANLASGGNKQKFVLENVGAEPAAERQDSDDQFGPDMSKAVAHPPHRGFHVGFPHFGRRRAPEPVPAPDLRPKAPAPEKQISRRSFLGRAARVVAAAVALTATAGAVDVIYNASTTKTQPGPSSAPGGGGPLPTGTPKVEITAAPTPRATAAPTPADTPEITAPPTKAPVKNTPAPKTPPPASASEDPRRTPAPEASSELDTTLVDWVSGKLKIKNSQRFIAYEGSGPGAITEYQALGIADSKLGSYPPGEGPQFAGVILGEEVVDNHLVFYIGGEDLKGGHYFFPMTVGSTIPDPRDNTTIPYQFDYYLDTNNATYPTGTAVIGTQINVADGISIEKDVVGKTVISELCGIKAPSDFVINRNIFNVDIHEYNAQANKTKAFYQWAFNIISKKIGYKSIPSPIPLNQRIKPGTFNEAQVPWSSRLRINANS